MFDCFLAQILVLIMMFLCSVRVLFIKNSRVDSFAAFAPLSLLVSACIFFCFGFSLLNLALFVLSFLVFSTNFRAILRLSAKLIVDTYNVVFVIFSILNLILVLGLAAIIILVRPVKYSEKDFNITKEQHTLTGNLSTLQVRDSFFSGERFSGTLFIYEPVIKDEITQSLYSENPILLFAAGLRGSVQNYEPYFMLLAQKGYTVMAADLYVPELKFLSKYSDGFISKSLVESQFLRRFMALKEERSNPERFKQILAEEQKSATKKYSALTHLALEIFGDEAKVFYIVDGVDFDSIYAVIDEFNTEPFSNAKGFFSMNRVDEYTTSGYGFIEQTDVLLAHNMGIERENKFFIPRYVANKTIKTITESR